MTEQTSIRIGVAGCTGRVGRLLVQELQSGAWPDLILAIGSASAATQDASFRMTTDAAELFAASDAVIDFTTPAATLLHAQIAGDTGTPLIVGTTGLDAEQTSALRRAAEKTPILYAANMSIGVAVLTRLVAEASRSLGPGWDIQIAETHHRHKKDAPSGTALHLGQAAGENNVGYASQRGGDVVGEHTVTYYGEGERIALTHIATDRALFARGALRAARWLVERAPGLYSMREVLPPGLPERDQER